MAYESKYFNENPPIKFGFNSIFYRVNAWIGFRRITLLIRKFGGTGRLLDVGCALGNSLNTFSQAGLKPTGCDISVWATERAKKTFPALEIVRTDALCLPFKSETFDVTTAFETLEHCQNLDLVSSQIKRVTKPNGLVLVSVPTTDLNDTYADRSHIWHKSLAAWLHFLRQYFEVLSVSYFMKFMKTLMGKHVIPLLLCEIIKVQRLLRR